MTEFTHLFLLKRESREPDLSAPRTCRLLTKLSAPDRDDYWLAEVDPPFLGQHFGLGDTEISQVIVTTRLNGLSLFTTGREDVPIYVARLLDMNVTTTHHLAPDQLELILWCYAKQITDEQLNHLKSHS